MKIKYFILALLAALACSILCGFTIDTTSSVKTLTKPYITTYECTHATLGNFNILEEYDYFKITFLNKDELEVRYKEKDGKAHSYKCGYVYNSETSELYADAGISAIKTKQPTKIENGKFTLSAAIDEMQLIMKFSA